ncbi:DUF167 domain-containing protein [Terriglobus saanensis]|uniref:UPF0235 protein AciPR4_3175 n=1 Tax=Terriglobus saanensis (strain ATCC BAA-1853 / DSM 23119 / SP1PR4) TaxID=401053 RepID=E8V7F7_TERSS|nr:DUF167 domain-containing protein [Terriglobus saanensis]ADV83931.1 protein of unknown function DUF167 [Terriglobus saanensis SP1PR4]
MGLAVSLVVREVTGGVTFAVRVQPGAKRSGVVGIYGEAVKIALVAPAVDGKANEALVRFVATLLDVPRMSVEILSGVSSRSKVVKVLGVTSSQVVDGVLGVELG